VLVVVVIIALLVSVVAVKIARAARQTVREEAMQLAAVLAHARDEAIVTGEPLAWQSAGRRDHGERRRSGAGHRARPCRPLRAVSHHARARTPPRARQLRRRQVAGDRGSRDVTRQARGFTLIEILVALAILAVALAAAVRSASVAADGTLELRERLAGTWVAQDRLAEYAARPLWPEVGTRAGNAEQAGMQFGWREAVTGTPNPRFRRIEVQVFAARTPDRAVATLVGYATRSEQR
jgi:general secretion pathway protein I